jgi:ribokinase
MGASRIVVVGSYNHDVGFQVARLPGPGETCLSLGPRWESPGGKGSNQAIAAARAGASVAIVAAIGVDAPGDAALALWQESRIDTTGVVRLIESGTGLAMILVDAAAENMIVVDSGANGRLAAAHVDAAAGLIAESRLLIAQLETPVAATLRAFELARAAGAVTLLNAAPAPELVDPSLLAAIDILVVNEGEGQAIAGRGEVSKIAASLVERVGRMVIVTQGNRGAMLLERDRPAISIMPPRVEVVDTTGAGDAFIGAFAARWIDCDDAPSALAWGVAGGALACTARGAAVSYPEASRIAALVQ